MGDVERAAVGVCAARRATLRGGSAEERKRVESARVLAATLAVLDEPLAPATAADLRPLAELTCAQTTGRLKVGSALAMPITVRNRLAHDAPTDPAWHASAADALRPLLAFLAGRDLVPSDKLGAAVDGPPLDAYPAPWFLDPGDGSPPLAFNGVDRDFAVLYVSDAGVTRAAPERSQDVLLAFGRLLGKADAREKDFRKLLAKLAPDEIRGVTLGDWLVGPPAGEGGFATVHVARQLSTGRKAAVKILRDGMDPEALQRFQQEAAFLSRFRQPNIVSVYGFGQEAWSAPRAFSLADEKWFAAFGRTAPVKTFIAMEWVEGRTLDEVFWAAVADPDRQPSVRTIVRWMAEAAGALAAVHAAGLIHRDVKPHNIMVAAGPQDVTAATTAAAVADADARHVKLMDFGIARQQRAERTLVTESGRVMGTPAYMSPEQIRAGDGDGDVGPASDVYSLCATFYELIAGRRMYRHDVATQDQVRTSKLGGHRPARLGTIARGVPWEVEALIMGGLEPEPADRHRSMEALERDLRRFLADEPIAYRTPSIARRAVLAYRRNRLVANLVAGSSSSRSRGSSRTCSPSRPRSGGPGSSGTWRCATGRWPRSSGGPPTTSGRSRWPVNGSAAPAGGRAGPERERPDRRRRPGRGPALVRPVAPARGGRPDRDRLARLRLGMTLRLLPRPVATWDFAAAAEPVATMSAVVTADGRRVVVAETSRDGAEIGRARVLDAATGAEVARSAWHDGATGMATASRDGGRLATVALGGVARTYDATGKLMATITRPGGVTRVVMAPGGDRLCVVSDSAHHVVEVVDPATGTPLFPPVRSDGPTAARTMFSDDGQTLLVATTAVGVRLVDAATGADRIPLVPVPMLWSAAISRDGRRFAAASGDGWGRAYDSATGEPLTPPLMHAGPVNRVEFDPAGTRLATAGTDKAVRVWSVEPGAVSPVNLPHPAAAFAVAFSPDGGRLITVAYDKALRAWMRGPACRWPPRSARPRRSWTSRSGPAGATGSPSSPRPCGPSGTSRGRPTRAWAGRGRRGT